MCFKKVCTTTLLDLGNLKEPLFAQLWDTSPLHWKESHSSAPVFRGYSHTTQVPRQRPRLGEGHICGTGSSTACGSFKHGLSAAAVGNTPYLRSFGPSRKADKVVYIYWSRYSVGSCSEELGLLGRFCAFCCGTTKVLLTMWPRCNAVLLNLWVTLTLSCSPTNASAMGNYYSGQLRYDSPTL